MSEADLPPIMEGPLDPAIEPAITILRRHGVKTFASCQGGEGHTSPKAWVRFKADTVDEVKRVIKILNDAGYDPFEGCLHILRDGLHMTMEIDGQEFSPYGPANTYGEVLFQN